MTLVSSANIMGIDEVVSLGRSRLYRLWEVKDLKLTAGERCALLFSSLRRYFGLKLVIWFQCFIFYPLCRI
jgi:hypothetical protein